MYAFDRDDWWDYDRDEWKPLTEDEIAHDAIAEQQERDMELGMYDDLGGRNETF